MPGPGAAAAPLDAALSADLEMQNAAAGGDGPHLSPAELAKVMALKSPDSQGLVNLSTADLGV
jgi:hypothetical protein